MKKCSKCKLHKPVSDFWIDKGNRTGLRAECAECAKNRMRDFRRNNPDKVRSDTRNRYWKDPAKFRDKHLKSKYGITSEVYSMMFSEQGGLCKICSTPSSRSLNVDHCHATGLVRGLLCNSCNRMLGHAFDVPEILKIGAAYLEKANNGQA